MAFAETWPDVGLDSTGVVLVAKDQTKDTDPDG